MMAFVRVSGVTQLYRDTTVVCNNKMAKVCAGSADGFRVLNTLNTVITGQLSSLLMTFSYHIPHLPPFIIAIKCLFEALYTYL